MGKPAALADHPLMTVDDELSDDLEELRASYQSKLAEIRELRERAGRVTSTARSRDGLISLEVGAQGQLVALSLKPGVYDRLSPQRLAAALTDLAKTATAQAAGQVNEIMAPVMPPGGMAADGGLTRWMGQAPGTPGYQVPPTRPQ
jgi:DNA-binding protein YbaB